MGIQSFRASLISCRCCFFLDLVTFPALRNLLCMLNQENFITRLVEDEFINELLC